MKRLFISQNILKIIALILMTLNHIGVFLSPINDGASLILKSIGGIAFPIFLFLLIEGINHTSSIKKYFLRLFFMSLIIFIGILIGSFIPSNDFPIYQFGNIFIDLASYVLNYYLIFVDKNKDRYIYLSLIFIFYIITFLIKINIIPMNIYVYKVLGGFFPQYSLFGLLLFLTTIISFKLYEKKVVKINPEFSNEDRYKFSKNIIYCIILAIFSILAYASSYIQFEIGVDKVIATYYVIAGIIILFYNYRQNKLPKSITRAYYFYYPLHLIILYVIFLII